MDELRRISKAPRTTRTLDGAVARLPHWRGPVAADLGRRCREVVVSERVRESEFVEVA